MASEKPGQTKEPPQNQSKISWQDVANNSQFIDALLNFMNESFCTMVQVKERTGISPGCISPVKMTQEERETTIKNVVAEMENKCNKEKETGATATTGQVPCYDPSSLPQTASQRGIPPGAFPYSTSYSKVNPMSQPGPRAPPQQRAPSNRSARRTDAPRSGTTQPRGVPPPENFYAAGPGSNSVIPSSYAQAAPRQRSPPPQSSYPMAVESSRAPAYQSGAPYWPPAGSGGRPVYSNPPGAKGPRTWDMSEDACPPTCPSYQNSGRSERRAKGPERAWN